jgi:Z1 domain-containing protein
MPQTLTDDRILVTDGRHTSEILRILEPDLGRRGVRAAAEKAQRLLELSVDPISGPPAQPSDGLLYGLIQSGKTSVITVAAAMAADNAFQCIVILTTDNDPLYDQTLDRVRAGLRGLSVLGKREWREPSRFARQLRTPPFVVVCSKNASMLQSLVDAFRTAKAKGLSVLIIDDEADQASLNTFTSKRNGQVSRINRVISDLRAYFPVNTYLQVTATPQALFLQRPDHRYRPTFSVISEPGEGYVGGEAFFGSGRGNLLRIVDLAEVNQLRAATQSGPTAKLPKGLRSALLTFLVGASAKVMERPKEGFAFLCHVSMSTRDHAYVVTMLDAFKEETINAFRNPESARFAALKRDLQTVYDDLAATDPQLPPFDQVLETIDFYIKGANTKLVNAISGDEISLDAVFNFFVGGNKLGRGVTIKNLLVSYYGRNPRVPNADTVLQHARMYGYRAADVGVTRLFLPQRLADHFSSIHQMETALRDLLQRYPNGCFEGVFISGPWEPTRRAVLDPTSLGYYVAGGSYNPSYPLRDASTAKKTAWLDAQLADVSDDGPVLETSIERLISLVQRCEPDPTQPIQLWNLQALKAALEMYSKMRGSRAYLLVRRGRRLAQPRRETQGILTGGEDALVPRDAPALFFFRQEATASGEPEVWWPQLRFADGNYVLAFSFDW